MFGITMANAQAALPHPGLTMEGTSLVIPLKPAKVWRPRGSPMCASGCQPPKLPDEVSRKPCIGRDGGTLKTDLSPDPQKLGCDSNLGKCFCRYH